MAKQHYKPEQIISKLREAEVELGRGLSVPLVCKQLGITDSTYYRWRQEQWRRLPATRGDARPVWLLPVRESG